MRTLALCLALVGSLAAATPYKVGDSFAAFSTKDQHDKAFTFEGGVQTVVVAFDMSSGKSANAFFEKRGASFLPQQKAIFISNIYGMPGIARTFAMPKMRRYPHRVLLADAEDFLARYPKKDDHLTVLNLDEQGVVRAIRFVDPKTDLPAVFGVGK
jgi:hypothetical protein